MRERPDYSFIVCGQVMSKSNSRRLVRFRGKTRSIKSAKAVRFASTAVTQLRSQWGDNPPLSWDGKNKIGWVGCRFNIFYPTNLQDVDPSLVMDALQEAGVLTNDRQIKYYYAEKFIDPKNPRVEIDIYKEEK